MFNMGTTCALTAVKSATALLLATTLAVAQDKSPESPSALNGQSQSSTVQADASDDRKKCKFVKAERNGGSKIVPADSLSATDARQFPYLLDDLQLRSEFQVDEKTRKDCGLFLFGVDTASAASSAAGGAAAGAAAAAPGGVAAVGAGIGVGTIGVGVVAGVGIAALVAGAVAGVATAGGGSGQSNSTTCTTCDGDSQ